MGREIKVLDFEFPFLKSCKVLPTHVITVSIISMCFSKHRVIVPAIAIHVR